MLAADSHFKIGLDAAAALSTETHQLAHSFAVEDLKRVVRKNLPIDVGRKEASGIVTAQTARTASITSNPNCSAWRTTSPQTAMPSW